MGTERMEKEKIPGEEKREREQKDKGTEREKDKEMKKDRNWLVSPQDCASQPLLLGDSNFRNIFAW